MPTRRTPVTVDERYIEEHFIRSSGPGGQNVNKVATAVELRFNVQAAALAPDVKARLVALAKHRIAADGALVIDSRRFRTQLQNREAARERLATLIERASVAPKRRKATKPKAAARENRLASKKRRGAVKETRARGSRDAD